ncbi:MAG: 4Fe-4S dicluster domain-containing protein, partial [Acidimicrobiia bacterium]
MTVVLLCEERVPEIEPQGWLPDANVAIVPDLCRRPGEIGRLAHGASHLVLGVCPGEYSLGAIQTQARRVGLDALGVELVDLRSAEGDAERLRLIVAGAVSRARAFGGSRPEHAKLCFPADLSRRSLLTLSLPEYLAVPLADESLCAADTGCRACVDACPRGALTWRNGRVATDKVTCEPCGLCVGSCPTGAMVSPTETPAQIEAQIRALLDAAIGPLGPRGIVFTCRRAPRVETAPGWFPVTLPCAGMAPPAWILAPLLMGAGAEGIRPCGDTGCPLGNDETIVERVAYCRKVLGLLGLSENRVTTDPAGAPQKEGPAVDLEDPFGPLGSAEVLAGLAELSGVIAPAVLEHPRSPVGTIEIREEVCTACTMCAQSCPTGALAQEHEEERVVVT